MRFEELGLNKELLRKINKKGFEKPTKIQELSIPHILKKKDVLGESATGSGKTLAFGTGIFEFVKPGKGIQALILTPTRELAEQVKNALSEYTSLRITAVYGGVSIGPQMDALRKAEVVVATPGRLLDHMQRNTIRLSGISILVLDEADRMLDMGFIDDVEKIIRVCPKHRQTLFFSATLPPQIRHLADKHMKNPEKLNARNMVDPAKLKQYYYNIRPNKKMALLIHLLKNERSGLVMVFCNTRRTTNFVVKNLKANKVNAVAIHGGFTQNKRSKTMDMFNGAKVQILVCTDVAARGLDIDDVSHVYNYELPKDPKDYVHRIGRTARAGEEGKVINLLADNDHQAFARIERDYRSMTVKVLETPQLQRVRIDTSRENRGRARPGRGRRRGPRRRR